MTESIFLVVATSGRAIAQGLKALEHPVAVIDGFADQDCHAAANICKKVKRTQFGLDQAEVLCAVEQIKSEYSVDGLFYDSAVEVDPELINEINVDFIFGNAKHTLLSCNDTKYFFSILDKLSIPYPQVSFVNKIDKNFEWLLKTNNSSGGLGVNVKSEKQVDFNSKYLQKKVSGISFSITFLSNGQQIKVLGANTQWSESLGDAIPYAYSGSINQTKLDKHVITTAVEYTQQIAQAFKLIGLNSVDCIYDGDTVYVIEINPRIPASYELYESKYGDVMRAHINVCKNYILPIDDREEHLRAHAIVYAPNDIQIPEDMAWPLWTADRPQNGEHIPQYEPICNVYSGGKNIAQVCEMISSRKKIILRKLTA